MIDNLTTITGWVTSDATNAAISLDNGNLKIALLGSGADTDTVGKPITDVDGTLFEELRIRIRADRLSNNFPHLDIKGVATTTYPYYLTVTLKNDTVTLGTWNIPIYDDVHYQVIRIALTGIGTFDEIVFTFDNVTVATNIWIDEILAVDEEVEADIMESIRLVLDDSVTWTAYTLTAGVSSGGTSIAPSNYTNLSEGSIIEIKEGANSEQHQIETLRNGESITFNSMKSGKTLVNTYTTAGTVRLVAPAVVFDDITPQWMLDRVTPVIVLEDMDAETDRLKVFHGKSFDTFKSDGTMQSRGASVGVNLEVEISVESRLISTHRKLREAIRTWLRYEGQQLRVAGYDYAVSAEPEHTQEKDLFGSRRIRTIFPITVMGYQEVLARKTDYETTDTSSTVKKVASL